MATKDAEDLARRVNEIDGWSATLKRGSGGGHSGGAFLVKGPGDNQARVTFTANAKNPLHYMRAEAELRRVGCPLPRKDKTPPKEDRMLVMTAAESRRSAELRARINALLEERFGGSTEELGAVAARLAESSPHDQFGGGDAQTPPEKIAAESAAAFLAGRDWVSKNLDRWEWIVDRMGVGGSNGDVEKNPDALRGIVASAIATMEQRARGEAPAMVAFAAFAKRIEAQMADVSERESVLALRRFLDGGEPDERFLDLWAAEARIADAIDVDVPGLVVGRAINYLDVEGQMRKPSEELRERLVATLTELGAEDFSGSGPRAVVQKRREFVARVFAWWGENLAALPQKSVDSAMAWLPRFIGDPEALASKRLLEGWTAALDALAAQPKTAAQPKPEPPASAEPESATLTEAALREELVALREEVAFAKELEAELTRERDEARSAHGEAQAEIVELREMVTGLERLEAISPEGFADKDAEIGRLSEEVARLQERLAGKLAQDFEATIQVERETLLQAQHSDFVDAYRHGLLRLVERVEPEDRESILLRLDSLAGINLDA